MFFYKNQISTKYKKIILKFFVHSVALALNKYHFTLYKARNSYKKKKIKSGMCKWSVVLSKMIDLYIE